MPNWTPEDEAHYTHVSRSAAQYDALKLKAARQPLTSAKDGLANALARGRKPNGKALAAMSNADLIAGLTSEQKAAIHAHAVANGLAPKPKAASTPKASTPKRDPDAEYQRGVAAGRLAERNRVGRVYDQAKVCGGDAAALRLLAITDMDSAAIVKKLYGDENSLVDAMKARHGLGGAA